MSSCSVDRSTNFNPSPPSISERAKVFYDELLELSQQYDSTGIQLLADGINGGSIIGLVERFMACQQRFQQDGKPTQALVGYHYTKRANILPISRKGFEPATQGQGRHGASFGTGVYIGNNPRAFLVYGDTGIITLYLLGNQKQMASYALFSTQPWGHDTDSLRGNKLMEQHGQGTTFPTSPYFDEIILRYGAQLLPLAMYPRELTNNSELLWTFCCELRRLSAKHFNNGHYEVFQRIIPSYGDLKHEHSIRTKRFPLSYLFAPAAKDPPEVVECAGPADMNQCFHFAFMSTGICGICSGSLHQQDVAVHTKQCKHKFHRNCLMGALRVSHRCPTCKMVLGSMGNCPWGTMTIELDRMLHCEGYRCIGTHVITYNIPDGVQLSCHQNPGRGFRGTQRKAYVPDCSEGKDLMKRLKYAFIRGLTFTIGTSQSTRQSNVVVWAGVHHKTILSRGPFGYPDPGYFFTVNGGLDRLEVPPAHQL